MAMLDTLVRIPVMTMTTRDGMSMFVTEA